MLDSFIIERIRRERESRESLQVPLHIEERTQLPPPHTDREKRKKRPRRGIAVIDFTI